MHHVDIREEDEDLSPLFQRGNIQHLESMERNEELSNYFSKQSEIPFLENFDFEGDASDQQNQIGNHR